MRIKTILSSAAGAAALCAVSIGGVAANLHQPADKSVKGGVPFIAPDRLARTLCGKNPGELSERRAFFVRAAQAWIASGTAQAAEADGPALASPHPSYRYTVTAAPAAQAWVDTGFAHMFNFNHEAATAAFRKAQEADPACAMCYWAEALALGPNINASMAAEDVPVAVAAMERAAELAADPGNGISPKETALIAALQTRYMAEPPADRTSLDIAFAEAMEAVAAAYPQDDFIAALAAEANMDAQRWDYWLAGGREPKGRTAKTLSLLETILDRNPDFGPAIHLYIHLTEASADPYRAIAYADRLAGLSDGLGHLIHMPSHSYYRVGKFAESLERNIEAVDTDEFWVAANDAGILYEYGYFTHNIHFALTSATMGGDGATALIMADKLNAKLPEEMVTAAPWIEPIKAAPYYAFAEFAEPAETLSLPAPGPERALLNGAWHYARGIALVRTGAITDALAEAEEIGVVMAENDMTADGTMGKVMEIARLTLIARAASAEADYVTALEAAEAAVALQDALPYTEPPLWYYPTRQTLAAIALAAGQTDRAEHLFIETLAQFPNNAWVLAGLAHVYEARGDEDAERYAMHLFEKAWLGDDTAMPALARL